jgi:hypothetical protein
VTLVTVELVLAGGTDGQRSRLRLIDGKVHDAQGRLLWDRQPGRPQTFNDLMLADFAALPSVLDAHGHRAATQAAERNLGMCLWGGRGMGLWGAELRARLATRQVAIATLPAETPCRWIAEQLTNLLDGPLLLDGAYVGGGCSRMRSSGSVTGSKGAWTCSTTSWSSYSIAPN